VVLFLVVWLPLCTVAFCCPQLFCPQPFVGLHQFLSCCLIPFAVPQLTFLFLTRPCSLLWDAVCLWVPRQVSRSSVLWQRAILISPLPSANVSLSQKFCRYRKSPNLLFAFVAWCDFNAAGASFAPVRVSLFLVDEVGCLCLLDVLLLMQAHGNGV